MKQTNPKLIYHLRQHPKAMPMQALSSLYEDTGHLQQDLAVLQRFGLVTVAADAVAWKGS